VTKSGSAVDRFGGPVDLGNMFQHPEAERGRRRAFSLIEILIVVIILGILAAIVMPEFTGASDTTKESSARRALQLVRYQVSYYEAQTKEMPQLVDNQWDDLLHNDYIQYLPVNPFNDWTLVAAAPGEGVGWVWRDSGTGRLQVYLTDSTGMAEWDERTE
jgi:prepilin-type N-terminal cleavage/methylation domain-containing protein